MKKVILLFVSFAMVLCMQAEPSHKFLEKQIGKHKNCKSVAITKKNGDALLYGDCGWATTKCPVAFSRKLFELSEWGDTIIQDIHLSELGRWFILYGNNQVSSYLLYENLEEQIQRCQEKLDYLSDLAHGRVLEGWSRSLSDGQERTAPVVIVEYGIESCYDQTLLRINRGHDFETARKAVTMTAERGLDVGVHFILGLPGETRQMMLDSCALINALPIRSVKFHQLQLVKGTRMEKEYEEKPQDFERFSLEEYIDFFVDMLERLRPDLFIERFVGEVPPRFVNEARRFRNHQFAYKRRTYLQHLHLH